MMRLTTTFAAVTVLALGLTSPTRVDAQPSLDTFGVLAGSTITNTGASIIKGNVGLSPGTSIIGFPPGIVNAPYQTFQTDAVAAQAQIDLTAAYNILASRSTSLGGDLTGQNLGGLVLTPGVYTFASAAQLTGTLTLNTLGNPNAIFIFQIGSALTTASNSLVTVVGAGGQVFWQVGSSATLGSTTSFVGDILALTSITLVTDANILCGAALARNGAVTLDSNDITSYDAAPCSIPTITVSSTLDTTATANERAGAAAIDSFVAGGGSLPLGFSVLASTLSPAELAAAFAQLSGESATGVTPTGTGAMDSFLSLVMNSGFGEERAGPSVVTVPAGPAQPRTPAPGRGTVKALGYADEDRPASGADLALASIGARPTDPRRWSVWGSIYGGFNNTSGDLAAGTHDRSAGTYGIAAGLDYRVAPDLGVGFALAGGGTDFGLSDSFGSGHSDMFQTAIYARKDFNAAYLSAALAYAWHGVSTDRSLIVGGADRFTAAFTAQNVAAEIEAGYRVGWFTPYAALREQAFYTPAYSESTASGSPLFALAYEARSTTTTRTELGIKFDRTITLGNGMKVGLRTRTAWVHDYWSNRNVVAMFQSLPGSSFAVTGAAPASDSLLVSAGAEMRMGRGFSLAGWFDGEFARDSQTYGGSVKLRHTW